MIARFTGLLLVFITVQNLVGIGIVVLKICDFQYFGHEA